MKNGQTEQNQGFRLGFVCPMAHKGTSGGEVCLRYKTDACLKLMRLSQSLGLAILLTYPAKTLIFTVLYVRRFFAFLFEQKIIFLENKPSESALFMHRCEVSPSPWQNI